MRVAWMSLAVSWGCAGTNVGVGDGILDTDEVPQVGWTAVFEGFAHDVAGTAVIVDEETLELRDFTYDGGGVNARLFLAVDGGTLGAGWELTDNLVGTSYDGETVTLDIPPDAPFSEWNLITLWCVPFAADFGSGVFQPPAE